MSAIIHHFVVHQIAVNSDDKLQAIPRDKCLVVSREIEALAQQINHSFNTKPGKGVGHFIGDSQEQAEPASTGFRFALSEMLEQTQNSDLDASEVFHSFSVKAMDYLIKALTDTGMVETGFLIFCQYEYLATHYLMVSLLNTRSHVEINDALELCAKEHLDLARMQLAVRIDLTQWRIQPEQARYISFIKGRMGRKVSDFFMQFIGCEEKIDVKQQNKQLIQSVDTYLSAEQLAAQEQHEHRDAVKSYLKEKIDSGESISLAELSEKLPNDAQSGRSFIDFNQALEQPVEDDIQPDPAALKQLAKFTGQGKGIALSFERRLLGDRIFYDPASDTLTIRELPPNLKDQLSRLKNNDF